MPDFTGYTYTGTTSTVWNPFISQYITGGDGSEWTTTINAGDYYGGYCNNRTYDRLISAALKRVRELASRIGEHRICLVVGMDVFESLRFAYTASFAVMMETGVIGYVDSIPVRISPDDALKKDVLVVIYKPDFAELEQYQKDDYVLDADVIWQVSSKDETNVAIHLRDTSYRVLTGEQLAHPGRGKSGTIGTLPPIKRSPPPLPSAEEFNDLFGDVLPK